MEYGIWNFHGGLWPPNNLATFNGTTLTPITAATLPTNTANFAITAGLLNPIITAAAACNLNAVFETAAVNNTINIDEQNSNDTDNSKFAEHNSNSNNNNNNNNDDNDDDDNVNENEQENEYDNENDATDNETNDNVNLVNSTNSSEIITTSDLSSNSYDDNAIDNTIKINDNNNQMHGYFAQQYAPVYNLVLGHFSQNPTTISVSDTTDESSDDENTATISTNNNFASTNNDIYQKQLLTDQQPSSISTSTNTTIISTSEQQQFSTNNDDLHICPVTGCEYKSVHIETLEQHISSHGEKLSNKNKKAANMQRIRYEREEYHCSMCPYTCTTEKAYLRHLRMHSLGETPEGRLSCAVCGRDRIGETALAKHMRKHRDDRFFCCDICVFRTVQLKKLIQHRRMHTGEKPHLCPHCAYRSARRDNLRSHVRRVHKRDNLWCDTFSPRGMLLTPSTSKTIHDESETPSESTVKNIEK